VSFLFIKIALVMIERFGIKISSGHMDGTSISVEGKYIQSEEKQKESAAEKEEEDEQAPIRINHGYSRDHRPDLKQFTLSLLTIGEEGIPLFLQVGDGNKLDSQAFPEMIKAFQFQWQGEKLNLFVMDAAFYEKENLIESKEKTNWLSRVPLTIKAAQELTKTLLPEQFIKSKQYQDYRFCIVCSEYAGVKQQWVVVENQQKKQADLKTLSKRIEQFFSSKKKSLLSLKKKEFACEPDAVSAAKDFGKTLNYHSLTELNIVAKSHYKRKGRPRPEDEVSHYTYHIQANLVEDEAVIQTYRHQAGGFIFATNLLDDTTWTADLLLQEYKAQQTTERGFRFIKDPLFFASRVFLKSTKRIMALAMIMTLALMVYSLGQLQLRQALEITNSTLPNQKGKPTTRPTLRWILQCFHSVHLVFVNGIKSSIQLTDKQNLILQFLGSSSRQYYFLS